jgi:hypothetical protein
MWCQERTIEASACQRMVKTRMIHARKRLAQTARFRGVRGRALGLSEQLAACIISSGRRIAIP